MYIYVKNIGEEDLENLIIVENEGDINILNQTMSNVLREWKISKLKIGDQWQTYYDIETENINKYVPEVYGAEDAKIYKNLLIDERIETSTIYDGVKTYQKVIIGTAVILLVIDLLF